MNWDDVRDAYVKGDGSLPDVARECGVNVHTLKTKSAAERWSQQRDEWRQKHQKHHRKDESSAATTRAREEFAQLIATERQYETVLQDAVDLFAGIVADMAAEDRTEDATGKRQTAYRGIGRDLADVAQAMNTLARLKRDLLDMPDQPEQAKQAAARAKVEVERERNRLQKLRDDRAAAAEGKASGSIHITVTGVEGSDDLGG